MRISSASDKQQRDLIRRMEAPEWINDKPAFLIRHESSQRPASLSRWTVCDCVILRLSAAHLQNVRSRPENTGDSLRDDSHPVSVVTPCWTRAADQHLTHWEPTRGPHISWSCFSRFSLFSSAGVPSIVDFLTPFIPTAVFCFCFSCLACEENTSSDINFTLFFVQIFLQTNTPSSFLNSHNEKYLVL